MAGHNTENYHIFLKVQIKDFKKSKAIEYSWIKWLYIVMMLILPRTLLVETLSWSKSQQFIEINSIILNLYTNALKQPSHVKVGIINWKIL